MSNRSGLDIQHQDLTLDACTSLLKCNTGENWHPETVKSDKLADEIRNLGHLEKPHTSQTPPFFVHGKA
ncbi:MAG: hypothetical protein JKY80_07795 [Mariprofundaceae bacterium]|nr:hypothetical protein [Mariprofundaceae bacterium]